MAKPRMPFPTKADVAPRTPDPRVREMLAHLERIGVETSFDRFDSKDSLLAKRLSPNNLSVPQGMKETGIPRDTLYGWRCQAAGRARRAATTRTTPWASAAAREKCAEVVETVVLNAFSEWKPWTTAHVTSASSYTKRMQTTQGYPASRPTGARLWPGALEFGGRVASDSVAALKFGIGGHFRRNTHGAPIAVN
jgi:hypothetical protein